MIRNIITAVILLAAFVSMASVVQVASAVEPELNLDISAFKDNLAVSNNLYTHPFSWTPDQSQRARVIKLYEYLVLPKSVEATSFSDGPIVTEQRLISFEIYQGDGLGDLRKRSKYYNNITLPDEDTEAYGVSIKQRF